MTVFGENSRIGTKGKRLRHWLCSSHRLVREADSVETCTVTALDAITAFKKFSRCGWLFLPRSGQQGMF